MITVSKHDMEHSEKIAEIYPYHCIVRKKIHETNAYHVVLPQNVEIYGKTRSRWKKIREINPLVTSLTKMLIFPKNRDIVL